MKNRLLCSCWSSLPRFHSRRRTRPSRRSYYRSTASPNSSLTKAYSKPKGVGADALYQRALTWFRGFTKPRRSDPRERLHQTQDHRQARASRSTTRPTRPASRPKPGWFNATITLAVKDGRFRYELTGVQLGSNSATILASAGWIPSPRTSTRLQRLPHPGRRHVKDLVAKLHEAMTHEKPVKDRDNW